MRLALLYLTLLSLSSYAQKSEIENITSKYEDSVTQKKYGIIALMKNDGQTTKSAIGLASSDSKMTTDKVFNIGSLTKMFTAVLIFQEIEKGVIKLNDSIGIFFPENLNVNPNITIDELLRHRSGLGEIITDKTMNKAAINYFDEFNTSNLYVKIPEPQYAKNEKFEYTNTNYILLGYILEIITDIPYSELLEKRIFEPSQMTNSYAYFSKNLPNTAHPMYNGQDLNKFINFKFYKDFCFSAGAIASTISDLERFFSTLYETNTLINREMFNKMTDFDSVNHYGLGIRKYLKTSDENQDYTLIGHSGDNLSFSVRNYYNPETKDLVIVISNHFVVPEIDEISEELIKKIE